MADSRFSALSTDPRYRITKRKQSHAVADPRFNRLLKDPDFNQKATVDRYGRKIKPTRLGGKPGKNTKSSKPDVNPPSKSLGSRDVVGSSEGEGDEDEDEDEDTVLAVKAKDPAREGGFSESDSDEESGSNDESEEDEAGLAEDTAGHEQTEEIPMGEVARKIAAVNLDWDNVRAADIMAVAASFAPVDGKVLSVTIYPSEFGRERLEREELEGPPREIFASSNRHTDDVESEDDDEEDKRIERRLQEDQVNDGDEFDTAKLRQYQLERLRYYYAVVECSNKVTAKALYDSMDGREYLSSANFFDLRFIPDEVSFGDDKPRDECTRLPDGYKPNEFRTEALTHSKVRLTWDDDDTTRKEIQKRAFSRAEIDENDLQAYIGSESSDADSVSSRKSAAEDRKAKKREAQRSKMRTALGLAAVASKSGSIPQKAGKGETVGDMQITFTSGLDSGKGADQGVFENEPQDEESTRDRYIRKERERKQKRKERMKAGRSGEKEDVPRSEDDAGKGDTLETDDGFDDPFFTDPAAAAVAEKQAKKLQRKQKLAQQSAKDEDAASRRAELELLMTGDQEDNLKHFDMREIEKAQKEARRKGKKKDKKKKIAAADTLQGDSESFKIETQDPRFKALFESHEYAIDPTNPRFKKTEGMKALLEEGRKKRKFETGDDVDGPDGATRNVQGGDGGKVGGDLEGLVKRLKGGPKSSG